MACSGIRFAQGKVMSVLSWSTQVGDGLECKGPIPKLPYKANMKKKIGMVSSFMQCGCCSEMVMQDHCMLTRHVADAVAALSVCSSRGWGFD